MLTQYGVIPVRPGAEGGLEVLLITSRETRRWVVPRGNPIPGKSPAESAAQEAFEEAGIVGTVDPDPVGRYFYRKRRRTGALLPAEVQLFRMRVDEERDDWPERGERERRWFAPQEAAAAVAESELAEMIRALGPGPAADARAIARNVLEALPEPALIVAAGRIGMSNAAARAMLGSGIEGEEVRLALRHPAAVERLVTNLPAAAEEVELAGLGEPGRRWTMSIAPLEDGALFVRLSDRSEAFAAERMRVDFVANASHELRTPLATLLGYTETLREQGDELDEATRRRFTAIVHDEARRMQRLVEDLVSLSRIEAERFTAPSEPLALARLVEEVRDNVRHVAAERGCEIRVEASADLADVAGDRAELLQMIDNLISNALRYGRPGTAIVVALAGEGGMVHLAVSDEGEGIPAEHIPRVTERFYRVDPGRSRALGGTGLGLSIVKHVVERHRGRLRIESEPGKGTIVHVLLPASRRNVMKV
ncbi:MAG: two-component system, OmpR family, phosphate regulon sensor histidine kinase PhoR [Sphingomonadales bacterium]|jgi:two-component system phosphate regulon sensor histidine kinase PhoR|nr:two-component system, OmpR family, phosphate regulon sensor histidine kinase PhoR [Sphingomonadales bacterium]